MERAYKREILKIAIIIVVVALLGVVGILYNEEIETMSSVIAHVNNNETIKFSDNSGFYDKTLNLKLSLDIEFPSGAEIYYTLDGNDPTNKSTKYSEKITLKLEDDIKVYPVKAVAYYKDEYGPIQEQVYVIGKNIFNQFDISVANISIDSDKLYNEENGMFVEKNLGKKNRESKESTITLFDNNGNIELKQNVLTEISGGTTVKQDVKSFKIRIDENYNDQINMIFDEDYSDYSIVSEYKNLKIRSGNQDRQKTNIREALIERLAKESNFDGYFESKKCILFLNGNFYGIFDIEQNFSNSFLGDKFSIKDNDEITKFESSDITVLKKSGILDYMRKDLNVKENRDELEKHIDMDNYLLYNAIEILAHNSDWPGKNVKAWKYTGEYEQNNKYTDGRLRYLLFDFDLAYYTENKWDYTNMLYKNIHYLKITANDDKSSLYWILKSNIYRNKFITIICDLFNTSFSKDNIFKVIDEEYEKIDKANKLFLSEEQYNYYKENVSALKDVPDMMEESIYRDIERMYNINEKYLLNIKNSDGLVIQWNNMCVYQNEEYNNEYYKGIEFEIEAKEYPGYSFKNWIVNGKNIEGKKLKITEDMVENGIINIQTVSTRNNNANLIISEVSAKSDSDWIKLTNVSANNVNISNYYISDDINNLKKYQLPNIVVGAGESIIVNGKKNYFSIGDYICNFNLNDKETLYLFNSSNDSIVDSLKIPKMQKTETYGRYDNSCIYKFFNNNDNQRKK